MDISSLSDEALMKGLQETAEDKDRFSQAALPYLEELYNRYYVQVLKLLMYYGLRKEEAEDVAQDVFIRLYRRCHSYDTNRPFKHWFFRMVYHAAISYQNEKRKQGEISLDEMENLDLVPDGENNFSEKFHFWHQFQDILYRMPEKLRVVLIWRLLEDWSFEEIGEILNITSRQVRNRYEQALLWVRERMGRKNEEI